LRISVKYAGLDELYDNYGVRGSDSFISDSVKRNQKRQEMLAQNKEYRIARWQRDAYDLGMEDYVYEYAEYYDIDFNKPDSETLKRKTKTTMWFEDEWYLQEHPEFYDSIFEKLNWTDRIDFSQVPTREVFNKYLVYLQLPTQFEKKEYRFNNLDLDEWGVKNKQIGWKSITEQKRRETMTAYERFMEEWAERGAAIEEALAGLRGE
jgi:hypothetical protein